VTTLTTPSLQARDAYEAIASTYDVLTGGYPHDRWLSRLEEIVIEHGLTGRRLLDVACGTGASFLPMLARGYTVTGCDISDGMIAEARRKASDAELHTADMRELPVLGSFDLITCLDDALNYLLDEDELEAALLGFARNLAPGGIAIWDLNTLAQYRGQFARDQVIAQQNLFIGWSTRHGNPNVAAGELIEIGIDVFSPTFDDHWQRRTSVHRQRHWAQADVDRLARRAGLTLLDVRGQHSGAVIDGALDELVHIKAIYVACAARKEQP
jgi:SAM-dependent methyltransferase